MERFTQEEANAVKRLLAGEPIPFRIDCIEWTDFTHLLRGGPGGAYGFCDVDLWARNAKGEYAKLSLHELNFRPWGFNPELEDGTIDETISYVEVEKVVNNE
jgi:hypothetical protein